MGLIYRGYYSGIGTGRRWYQNLRFLGESVPHRKRSDTGEPVYPKIFNIVVDSVVRAVLLEVYELQVAQHELGWLVGEHNI